MSEWLNRYGQEVVVATALTFVASIMLASMLLMTSMWEETKRQAIEKGAHLCTTPVGDRLLFPIQEESNP